MQRSVLPVFRVFCDAAGMNESMPKAGGHEAAQDRGRSGGADPVATFVARAHWSIFLPALVVALLWGLVYLLADNWTPRLSGIASVSLVVEAVIVPLLFLHAWGRAYVLGLRVGGRGLEARAGFPRRGVIEVGAREIAELDFGQSPLQRYFGAGRLDIRTESGARIRLDDLADAKAAAGAVRRLMAAAHPTRDETASATIAHGDGLQ